MRVFGHFGKLDCPDIVGLSHEPVERKCTQQKPEVADAVHYKGFLTCITSRLLVEVVTDKQVGTQTYTFPANKHQQQVVSKYQQEHGKHKEVEVSEEAV